MTPSGRACKGHSPFLGTSIPTWLLLALFLSLQNLAGLPSAYAQHDPYPDVAIYPPFPPPAETRTRTRTQTSRTESTQAKLAAVDKTPAAASTREAKPIVLLAGEARSTQARSGEEMAALLAGAGFKLEPRIGRMSLTELGQDRQQADLAIVQSDALEEARREKGEAWASKLAYVARLYHQEIHIVARPNIASFADLDRRTIATSDPETPEGRATSALFQRAQMMPRLLSMDHATAIDRLARGEIDAAVFIGGKPAPLLADVHIDGLRLIAIPYRGSLQDFYYPARLASADYPHLVAEGADVETLATSTLLIALDGRPNAPRHAMLARMTEQFFDRFPTLLDGHHHPKWREVNLAADVPGWRRFAPAQKWLDRAQTPHLSSKQERQGDK